MRYLVSYHYAKAWGDDLDAVADRVTDGNRAVRDRLELFVDSGAFSALTQGAPIHVDDYGEWLTRPAAFRPAVIANLDVIGNDEASAQGSFDNWLRLRDRWAVDTLPAVHLGEPLEWLDRYAAEGVTYAALGGLVGRPWKVAAPWTIAAHERAASLGVGLHGFGMTGASMMRLPWRSVDSTSWASGFRFGQVQLSDRYGRIIQAGRPDRSNPMINALIVDHGHVPAAVWSFHIPTQVTLAVTAWRRWEQHVAARHRRDVLVYLANGSSDILQTATLFDYERNNTNDDLCVT